ncbi:MAG: hypothetical protein QOH69_1530 [Actinomycetota bacterium]|jgi:hypothetical protein|nr:hypothetical protein [Actinomycetota bacterium]
MDSQRRLEAARAAEFIKRWSVLIGQKKATSYLRGRRAVFNGLVFIVLGGVAGTGLFWFGTSKSSGTQILGFICIEAIGIVLVSYGFLRIGKVLLALRRDVRSTGRPRQTLPDLISPARFLSWAEREQVRAFDIPGSSRAFGKTEATP